MDSDIICLRKELSLFDAGFFILKEKELTQITLMNTDLRRRLGFGPKPKPSFRLS